MRPFSAYTLDFFICLLYILFSFLLCLIIFFNYIEILFLFEVYPLLIILPTKRFILTQITQLFNSIWFFSLILSSFFIYPLAAYELKYFFNSGWYNYQIKLCKNLFIINLIFFIISFFIISFFIIPMSIHFFLYWEILDDYSLLRIEAEISLYFYIVWLTTFKFTVTFVLLYYIKLLIIIFYVTKIKFIYFYSLKYKKIVTFTIICLLFILVPPEFIVQMLIVLLTFIFVELFFFFICIKYLIKNAHIKATFKKPS